MTTTAHGVTVNEGASPARSVQLGANQVLVGAASADPVPTNVTSLFAGNLVFMGDISGTAVSGSITATITGLLATDRAFVKFKTQATPAAINTISEASNTLTVTTTATMGAYTGSYVVFRLPS